VGPILGGRLLHTIPGEEFLGFVTRYQGHPDARLKSFGDSSRHCMFRHIKVLCKWAKETGLLQTTPCPDPDPWKIRARERPMTEDEYNRIMGRPRAHVRFKEVMEIMWRTGMRPGEGGNPVGEAPGLAAADREVPAQRTQVRNEDRFT